MIVKYRFVFSDFCKIVEGFPDEESLKIVVPSILETIGSFDVLETIDEYNIAI